MEVGAPAQARRSCSPTGVMNRSRRRRLLSASRRRSAQPAAQLGGVEQALAHGLLLGAQVGKKVGIVVSEHAWDGNPGFPGSGKGLGLAHVGGLQSLECQAPAKSQGGLAPREMWTLPRPSAARFCRDRQTCLVLHEL